MTWWTVFCAALVIAGAWSVWTSLRLWWAGRAFIDREAMKSGDPEAYRREIMHIGRCGAWVSGFGFGGVFGWTILRLAKWWGER